MEISLHVNIDITLLRVLSTGNRAKYPHTGNTVFGGILRHILTQQSYIFGLCLHKRCFNEPNISFICHPYKKTGKELSEFLTGRFLPLSPEISLLIDRWRRDHRKRFKNKRYVIFIRLANSKFNVMKKIDTHRIVTITIRTRIPVRSSL